MTSCGGTSSVTKEAAWLGSVGYAAQINERGEVHVWLEERWINKLRALRGDRAKATPSDLNMA
jgi:hypothetical protein